MRQSPDERAGLHVSAQIAAAWSELNAEHRAGELAAALRRSDRAFLDALREVETVRDFVGAPGSILGNTDTKHGEIAEQVHVAVNRAWDVLQGRAPGATFDGVARTGPVDYVVDGVGIQSKFYNGLRNTLNGVGDHAGRYPAFSRGQGRYHIPSDQHSQMDEIRRAGGTEGLSDRSAAGIQRLVGDLERSTGRPIGDLIEPGDAEYAEVQRGRVHDTLQDRENRLAEANDDQRQAVRAGHGPSLAGLGAGAAVGAAAGGGIGLAQAIWLRCREGRRPFRTFTVQDWKDVGVVAAHGAGGGAVAGSAVYVLTNATALAAPYAGSLVSALMGIGALLRHHHVGAIDAGQFVEASHVVAMEAAIVGLTTAAGQAVVPIPMLGAVLGSLAGKLVASALKDGLGEASSALVGRLAEEERLTLEQLDREYRCLVQQLGSAFDNLESLAAAAFDLDNNAALLKASVELAEAVGVPEGSILRTLADVDVFMQE